MPLPAEAVSNALVIPTFAGPEELMPAAGEVVVVVEVAAGAGAAATQAGQTPPSFFPAAASSATTPEETTNAIKTPTLAQRLTDPPQLSRSAGTRQIVPTLMVIAPVVASSRLHQLTDLPVTMPIRFAGRPVGNVD